MKKGAICITIAECSCRGLVDQAKKASAQADFIEIRFDRLPPDQLELTLTELARVRKQIAATIIGTFRSSSNGQGGFRDIPLEERTRFWRRADVRSIVDWPDVEMDIVPEALFDECGSAFKRVIRSHHDLVGSPGDTEVKELKQAALSLDPGANSIYKLATSPHDISDAIPVWNTLKSGDPVIPIGMGEYGIWTRILGLAHGSVICYAKLAGTTGTAPGQLEFHDLKEFYRADELDHSTEVYGIVGKSSVNSLSPYLHNPSFVESGLNAVYIPVPVINAREFFSRMVSPLTREVELNLRGLSVTHPHKEVFAELVDDLDESAKAIGAVNTVKIRDGRVIGFNTDADGFIRPLKERLEDLNGIEVGIVGTGGAAKAAGFALRRYGANVTYISRDVSNIRHSSATEGAKFVDLRSEDDVFKGLEVLVNASPLGSRGEFEKDCPVPPNAFEGLLLAYDMVYNPLDTRFLQEASNAGVPTIGGLEMLIEQAVRQFEIWTGRTPSKEIMLASATHRLSRFS